MSKSKLNEAYELGLRAGHINCIIDCTGQCSRFGAEHFDPPFTDETKLENPFDPQTQAEEFKRWEDGESNGYSDCSAHFDGVGDVD